MRHGRRNHFRWVFFAVAVVSGGVYWWFEDWWAYVDFPEGPMPKFVVPWWWQVIESGIVGALAGGVVAGGLWLLSRLTGGHACTRLSTGPTSY